jgi:hypothetical protein
VGQGIRGLDLSIIGPAASTIARRRLRAGVDGAFVALIAWFGAFFSYRYGPSFVKRGFHLWETRMTGWEELEISSLPFDFSGRRFTRASARVHMENSNFLFEISM